MTRSVKTFRFAAVSAVKHAYVPEAVARHPRFDIVVVTDDADSPSWVHERNEKFAEQQGVPYVMGVEKAIEAFTPEVAVISSEAERHCDLGGRAANAGLHIVVDKPLSPSLDECNRLLDAVKNNNVKSLVWNRNFLPAVLQAKQVVESGELGDLVAAHCDFYFAKDAGPPKGPSLPAPINWLERQQDAHSDGSDGGVGIRALGELEIEGLYPLAYLRMLTNAPIRRGCARTATHFHQANVDNEVDDLATVTLEMDRGITGSLCIGRIGAASHPEIGEIKLHLLGTKGGIVISEPRPEVGFYYKGQSKHDYNNYRVANDNDYLLGDDFANAIDNNADTILDVEGGRDICAVVQAAIRSGRSNQAEEVTTKST